MVELTTSISQLVKMSHLGVNATPAQLDIAIRQRLTLSVSGTRPEVIEAKLDLNGTDDILVWSLFMNMALVEGFGDCIKYLKKKKFLSLFLELEWL